MMASSPGCSSAVSPKAEDVHEADVFSDDSGVDVKQPRRRLLLLEASASASHRERRNKRKSSEPKRRKDVLLMKRFRWEDTDEEEDEDEEDVKEGAKEEDFLLREEEERPGSGDSGCCREDVAAPTKKRTSRPAAKEVPRQSVIRKNEASPPQAPPPCTTDPKKASPGCSRDDAGGVGRPSRNYKSMSRQRRIEANARERTRVHTIGAAFESLRRAVPAYAHNQKLSKLAVLRIASAYIVALACLSGGGGGGGEEEEERGDSMPDCVERCTRTIQAEGRSRRRTSKVRATYYTHFHSSQYIAS